MKRDILKYIKKCLVCKKVKALPTVHGGYDSIFVVVDRLTKVAHLILVKKTYTAFDIAKVFLREIFRLHGLPRRIVMD